MAKQQKQNIPVTGSKETKSSSSIMHPLIEVERAFDRLVGRGWPLTWHMRDFPALDNLLEFEGTRLSKLDIIDRPNEVMVRAEVPGLEKKDVTVSLTDNLLTIKGRTQSEKKEEKGDYHRHEISSSSFARSVSVPGTLDATKVVASLKDGILEIKLPKTTTSKSREISVQ